MPIEITHKEFHSLVEKAFKNFGFNVKANSENLSEVSINLVKDHDPLLEKLKYTDKETCVPYGGCNERTEISYSNERWDEKWKAWCSSDEGCFKNK